MTVEIVAELSGNHLGDINRAKALIHAAKDANADAVKLQTYTPDTITVKGDHPSLTIQDGPWKGRTLWDLYAEAATPWEWHAELFAEARKLDLECFSTPFDTTAVDFLEGLGCPRYKVSSFDVGNVPLLERIGRTAKPVIMSCGMTSDEEIVQAAALVDEDLTLLHCVSEYPAQASQMNMRRFAGLSKSGFKFGLSDHSMSNTAAIIAASCKAVVIEKHICLSRADGGPDSGFSLEPQEFKEMVRAVREAEAACSAPKERRVPTYRRMRPSLWVIKDVRAGELATPENVAVRRPDDGLPPSEWDQVMGARFRADTKAGQPLISVHRDTPMDGSTHVR